MLTPNVRGCSKELEKDILILWFTIEQINEVHESLGSMKNFLLYVQALKQLGVERYESYLTDGHSQYFGSEGYNIESSPVHEKLTIAEKSNKENFLQHLSLHAQRKTNYIEMSRGLAESGIEKWVVNTSANTISYYDKEGSCILTEGIK